MSWLIDVLDVALPQLTSGERDKIAEKILAAVPGQLISQTIASSAATVLRQRAIADGAGELARELGNNTGAAVLLMLQATGAERWAFCSEEDCAWGGEETQLVDGERCPKCGGAAIGEAEVHHGT